MTRNTTEQQAVIDSNADLLAVDAFAGTGKTSTLVQYALARPDQRILYIAFIDSESSILKCLGAPSYGDDGSNRHEIVVA